MQKAAFPGSWWVSLRGWIAVQLLHSFIKEYIGSRYTAFVAVAT
jgi:hypothetical protein